MNFEFTEADWVLTAEGHYEIRRQKENNGDLIITIYRNEPDGTRRNVIISTLDMPNEIILETNNVFSGACVAI